MKYPNIIFYRSVKYKYIDKFIIEFQDQFDCTFYISGNEKYLNNMFNCKYQLLITFGDDKAEYDISKYLPKRFEKQWIHYTMFPEIEVFNSQINNIYIENVIGNRSEFRTEFSVFSSCFNSYDKILRAFNSMKTQTFLDWEWVIIDDSPDDKHFEFLKENLLSDARIRLYKRSSNSGSIGNVKNEAVSLCRGKYLLELDHDDEIVPELLQNAYQLFNNDSSIGFIYSDFINVYENGENFEYPGNICMGYGSYYMQKYNDVWRYVYNTPNINNITLSLLLSCPNHARIWRRDVLNKLNNFSEYLYVCDDYEIILKTVLHCKIVKLKKMGYIQYINNNGNNFSNIRNTEINRIGPNYISPLFFEKYKINEFMKDNNAYESNTYLCDHTPIWKRKDYAQKYINGISNIDYDKQYCIIGMETLYSKKEYIDDLYQNTKNDFIVLDSSINIDELSNNLDNAGFDRMKCYSLMNCSQEELINFFNLTYVSCNNTEIIFG